MQSRSCPMQIKKSSWNSSVEPMLNCLKVDPKDLNQRAELQKILITNQARNHLNKFVRAAWPIVEPSTVLKWNWHIDAISEHLEAVTNKQIQRLVINIPPGHMKSLIVSVFWPAWVWITKPEWKGLFSSYASELAIRDSVKCRTIIESDWYRQGFQNGWNLSADQNRKDFFQNTKQGFRISLSVGGKGTGFRGDAVIVDDPLNAADATSKAIRDSTIAWWDQTMSSRLNDQATGARVIIMQRLHEDDLTGHVLLTGGWEHLCLPSEFEPKRKSVTSLGVADKRDKDKDL